MSIDRTVLDKAALHDAIENLDEIKSALQDTISGTGMSAACQNRNLDYLRVRKLLTSASFQKCRTDRQICLEDFLEPKPDGYQKLYADIFKLNDIEVIGIQLPIDYKETILEYLNDLTERECGVIELYYGIGSADSPMTLSQIADDIYHVSRQRICQIKETAIQKLANKNNLEKLVKGNIRYHAEQQAEENRRKAYKESFGFWVEKQARTTEKRIGSIKAAAAETADRTDIAELDLSTRSYNCLKRAGVNTIKDLLDLSEYDLMKIRNMGIKSKNEVVAACNKWIHDAVIEWEQQNQP